MDLGPQGAVFVEAAGALAIVNIEGDSMRLDNVARATLVGWLQSDCAV
jgi:hypothetical protein